MCHDHFNRPSTWDRETDRSDEREDEEADLIEDEIPSFLADEEPDEDLEILTDGGDD